MQVKRSLHKAVALGLLVATSACKHSVEFYCDESRPCLPRYPDRPYCDLSGDYPESEGIGRTCIPFPDDPTKDFCLDADECPSTKPICGSNLECRGCEEHQECGDLGGAAGLTFCSGDGSCLACEPSAFIRCDSSEDGPVLISCRADGSGEDVQGCGVACDDSNQRCIDCLPDSAACAGVAPEEEHVVCDGAGQELSRTGCVAGCDDTAGCEDIDPRNCLGTYLDMTPEAPSVVVGGVTTIDTDSGSVLNSETGSIAMPSQAANDGPCADDLIRVFMVSNMEVEDLVVTGAHALAIVSNGDIVITGNVSVSAVGEADGPGSSSGTCAGSAGTTIPMARPGAVVVHSEHWGEPAETWSQTLLGAWRASQSS
jgi:hypothetical protein